MKEKEKPFKYKRHLNAILFFTKKCKPKENSILALTFPCSQHENSKNYLKTQHHKEMRKISQCLTHESIDSWNYLKILHTTSQVVWQVVWDYRCIVKKKKAIQQRSQHLCLESIKHLNHFSFFCLKKQWSDVFLCQGLEQFLFKHKPKPSFPYLLIFRVITAKQSLCSCKGI